ncbi:MAG: hypothetical protein OXH22_03920 [Chloroflexi bacterium]|nr:hypothetical protein [Chloroflexota bacterium]
MTSDLYLPNKSGDDGLSLLTPKGMQFQGRRKDGLSLLEPWLPAGEEISMSPPPQGQATIRSPMDLRTGRSFLPRVAILFGRRGQGKTLWLTAMLWMMKERGRLQGTPRFVATNYWTSFSDHASPYLLDELQEFPDWAYNAIIGIDEVVDLLPSARAMSNYTLLSQSFFRQIRKRGCEVLAATQFPQELSRGILRQVDFFLETELVQYGKGVRTYWHDWWGQFTGQYKQRYWPPERDAHDYAFTLWGTDQMFGHYRTEEVVATVVSDSRDEIISQQWQEGDMFIGDVEKGEVQNVGRRSFSEILDMIDGNAVALLDDLMDIAREDLDLPYLSMTRLREILTGMGFIVAQDDEGDWVVSK